MENKSNVEIINNVGTFTVFLKVAINFERFGVFRDNDNDIKGDSTSCVGI